MRFLGWELPSGIRPHSSHPRALSRRFWVPLAAPSGSHLTRRRISSRASVGPKKRGDQRNADEQRRRAVDPRPKAKPSAPRTFSKYRNKPFAKITKHYL